MKSTLHLLKISVFLVALNFKAYGQIGADVPVFISEIHYDNAGTDVGEFIEIFSPSGFPLDGWSVELINGTDSSVYDTVALSGFGTTFSSLNDMGSSYVVNFPTIQNGAPDGIVLRKPDGTIAEFISYEGTMTFEGVTSTDIGVSENSGTPIGTSLQNNGFGNWQANQAETPGEQNPSNLNIFRQAYQLWWNGSTNNWNTANWDLWDRLGPNENHGIYDQSVVNINSGSVSITAYNNNGFTSPQSGVFPNNIENVIQSLNITGGAVTITAAGRLDVNNTITNAGNLTISGEINVTNTLNNTSNVTLNSNLISVTDFQNSGTLNVGIGDFVTATITGNLTNNGTLNLEIEDDTSADLLLINGDFNAGGTLDIFIDSNHTPADGTTQTLIEYTGDLSGDFTTVNIPDGWVLDMSSTGEVNVIRQTTLGNTTFQELSSVQIYPNPTSESIHVSSNNEIIGIEIYNLLGQKILSTSSSKEINIQNLEKGIYLVNVKTPNGELIQKIIKE